MKVRFKKFHENAVIPSYARPGDAALDITCTDFEVNLSRGKISYYTGLSVEIPEGFVGLLFSRSSVSKKDLIQSNAVGVIDSGYRGEIVIKFNSTRPDGEIDTENVFPIGSRVAQLMIIPRPEIIPVEAKELSKTERGAGGFGSTGA